MNVIIMDVIMLNAVVQDNKMILNDITIKWTSPKTDMEEPCCKPG
jgi:hypothetical protein